MATERTSSAKSDPLAPFSDPVRGWFQASFEEPTPAQAAGWPVISSGANALICAPTGSGKTLAAFLWGIDRLASEPERLGEWSMALLLAWAATAAILLASPLLYRLLGRRALSAIERLMGMLLVAISVQMLLDGLSTYLKGGA